MEKNQQKIKVLIFGRITEIVGGNELEIPLSLNTTNDLKNWLLEEFPSLQKIQFLISVNRKITNENTMINPTCELALLPPFSGG